MQQQPNNNSAVYSTGMAAAGTGVVGASLSIFQTTPSPPPPTSPSHPVYQHPWTTIPATHAVPLPLTAMQYQQPQPQPQQFVPFTACVLLPKSSISSPPVPSVPFSKLLVDHSAKVAESWVINTSDIIITMIKHELCGVLEGNEPKWAAIVQFATSALEGSTVDLKFVHVPSRALMFQRVRQWTDSHNLQMQAICNCPFESNNQSVLCAMGSGGQTCTPTALTVAWPNRKIK
jgi:hypothetical protein